MARSLRSLSGSNLAAAPTLRSILAPPMKARRCHHPSRQRQPSFGCDPVSNHAPLCTNQTATADSIGDAVEQGRSMRDTARQADRLAAIRLRYTINTLLEDQGLTTP